MGGPCTQCGGYVGNASQSCLTSDPTHNGLPCRKSASGLIAARAATAGRSSAKAERRQRAVAMAPGGGGKADGSSGPRSQRCYAQRINCRLTGSRRGLPGNELGAPGARLFSCTSFLAGLGTMRADFGRATQVTRCAVDTTLRPSPAPP